MGNLFRDNLYNEFPDPNKKIEELGGKFEGLTNKSYVYLRDYANGDNKVETSAIQQALADSVGKTLYWNKQKGSNYLTGQLVIPSNIKIIFEPGTKVQAIDTLSQTATPREVLFKITDVSNIFIDANMSELYMNKSVFTGEHNHGISMNGASNVEIKNVVIRDCGGDGIYIGNATSTKTYCENIRFVNCVADNNRRNNLSIISVDGFYAENCTFSNAAGIAPQSGVDVEPNLVTDRLKNIRFNNCKSLNNVKEGFRVLLWNQSSASQFVDVIFENCYSNGDNNGFLVTDVKDGVKGIIKMVNCISELNEYNAFNFTNCSGTGVSIIVDNGVGVDVSTLNSAISKYATFLITDSTSNAPTTIGNIKLINCKSIDRRATPLISKGFAVAPSTLVAYDIDFINCESFGHFSYPFDFGSTSVRCTARNDKKYSFARTATGTVNPHQSNGQLITNEGATVPIRLTLTAAREGTEVTFVVKSAFDLKVFPTATEQILPLTTGVGRGLASNQIGSMLTIRATKNATWEVTNIIGTWTDTA